MKFAITLQVDDLTVSGEVASLVVPVRVLPEAACLLLRHILAPAPYV